VATAFFGGAFFGGEFFSTSTSTSVGGGRGHATAPWRQKWRQELVDLLAEEELKPVEVPRKIRRAITRVLDAAPPDDSAAKRALRSELEQLKVSYSPVYLDALRYEVARLTLEAMRREESRRLMEDEEDAITVLLLH
jgi:hypothetical protein